MIITMNNLLEWNIIPRDLQKIVNSTYTPQEEKDIDFIDSDIVVEELGLALYSDIVPIIEDKLGLKLYHADPVDVVEESISLTMKSLSRHQLETLYFNYKVVPIRVEENRILYVTKDIDAFNDLPLDSTFTQFNLSFIKILTQILTMASHSNGGVTVPSITGYKIEVCSNKFYRDARHLLSKDTQLFLPKKRVMETLLPKDSLADLILYRAIKEGATGVFITPCGKDMVQISISVYNEYIPLEKLSNRREIESGFLRLAGTTADMVPINEGIADIKMRDLGSNPRYEGRCNIISTAQGYSLAIRIMDTQRVAVKKLDNFNISSKQKTILKRIVNKPYGVFLLAGDKGNGKTTTLYSCMRQMAEDRPRDRIEEFGDVIEETIPEISQISITSNEGLTFKSLSKASTRREAKIIVLNEINSFASMEFAVNTATQGTLLLSTIHASSVSMILNRINNIALMEKEALGVQMIELLNGMAHQVMFKETCPVCRKSVALSELPQYEELLKLFNYKGDNILVAVEGNKNCPHCRGRGIIVNRPVISLEILEVTDGVRRLLFEGMKNGSNMKDLVNDLLRKSGTHGINNGFQLMEEGRVDIKQIAHRYSVSDIDEALLASTRKGV